MTRWAKKRPTDNSTPELSLTSKKSIFLTGWISGQIGVSWPESDQQFAPDLRKEGRKEGRIEMDLTRFTGIY
jgi:hypothetical protein